MRLVSVLLVAILMLGACADKDKRAYFDGNYYPAKAKKAKGDREAFSVSVRKTSQGLSGAREAGRHAGARYCIKNFGYSGIEWVNGPDSEDRSIVLANGNLLLTGRCHVWE